jgi:tRNA A58 N-methylase Trm61
MIDKVVVGLGRLASFDVRANFAKYAERALSEK